jgi:hypothetical protein
MRGSGMGRQERKQDLLFLKEKKQKNFYKLGLERSSGTGPAGKSFLLPQAGSLFFKIEARSSLL